MNTPNTFEGKAPVPHPVPSEVVLNRAERLDEVTGEAEILKDAAESALDDVEAARDEVDDALSLIFNADGDAPLDHDALWATLSSARTALETAAVILRDAL